MATIIHERQLELLNSTLRSSVNETVITAFTGGVNYYEVLDGLILTSQNVLPEKTLFYSTTISGRRLGDIVLTSTVNSSDVAEYSKWIEGTQTNQTYINYIEDVLNPYILANSTTYSAYISDYTAIAKNQLVSFYKQLDNQILPNSIYLKADTLHANSSTVYTWSYSTDLDPNNWTIIPNKVDDNITLTYTDFITYIGTATSLVLKVDCLTTGFAATSANYIIYYKKEEDEVIQAFIGNPYISVVCDDDGLPIDTDGTGAVIQVYIDGKLIPYSDQSLPDTFSIGTITTAPVNSITLGTPVASNSLCVYSNITGITSDIVTVTYPVIINNRYGNPKPAVNVTQRFTKIRAGVTVDTTAAPTPTNVEITAGLTSIFIKHDIPNYTQGNGHDKTLVYAVLDDDSGTQTIADSELLETFVGSVGNLQSGISKSWRIWLKWVTKQGYASTTPFGGTNGYLVTTSKIGNSDLGPLIVEAGNLASNAVTAAKIAASSITAAKFDTGVEPLSIVEGSDLPTEKTTTSIFLQGTKKIYRWDGTAYIATVPAADIIDQLQAGQIAAGAISAEKIQASAITTKHLAVADLTNLCYNGKGESTEGWTGQYAEVTVDLNSTWWPNELGSKTSLSFSGRDSYFGPKIPVKQGDEFFVQVDSYPYGGNDANYNFDVGLRFVDKNGDVISWIVGAQRLKTLTGAQTSEGSITAPANTAGAYVWVRVDKTSTNVLSTAKNGYYATNIIVKRKNNASLLVDGAITATKLAANSIAVGTAAIQEGAIVNAMIGDATIESAKIANLDATIITTGTLDADRIAANSITTNKLLVGGQGSVINTDPNTVDITAWINVNALSGTISIGADTSSPTGSALKIASTAEQNVQTLNSFPIRTDKNYRLSMWVKQQSGSSKGYLLVHFIDAQGNTLIGSSYNTGWSDTGTYHYFGRVNQTFPTTWTEYSISFGPGETAQIPESTVSVRIGFLANYSNGSGEQRFTGIRLVEKITGELVVDGSITAGKIDTRGLDIKDANGNIIFSSGAGLDYSLVSGTKPPSDADKTGDNTAAGITNQGAFATLDAINSDNISTYIASSAIGMAYIEDTIQSTNYSATNKTGWQINKAGTATFNEVNVRGTINGVDYTGYAWPASGKTGFHLGPDGLLLGNYNNNRYFQVSSAGNIYAPGFSIVNGDATLTNITITRPTKIASAVYQPESGNIFQIYTQTADYGSSQVYWGPANCVFDIDTGYNDEYQITTLNKPGFYGKAVVNATHYWYTGSGPGNALLYKIGAIAEVITSVDHYSTGATSVTPGGRIIIRVTVPVPTSIFSRIYQIRIDGLEWGLYRLT